ncbi:O-acyltransferase like protein-like [Convolutriloba macropyga]|uniref:O-acyltransferase like protein-like n=1 Tax=Convolutriloba macropyga TaxID=536237 RepID=UPI003F51BBEF
MKCHVICFLALLVFGHCEICKNCPEIDNSYFCGSLIQVFASLNNQNEIDNEQMTKQCREDAGNIIQDYRVIDAWGKPEAGLFQGNNFWFGDPGLCNSLDGGDSSARFKYSDRLVALNLILDSSKAELKNDQRIPITLSACLPESCGANDTALIVEGLFDLIDKETSHLLNGTQIQSVILPRPGKFDFWFYFTSVLFGALAALMLIATLFDYCIAQSTKAFSMNDWLRMEDPSDGMDIDINDDLQILHQQQDNSFASSASRFLGYRCFRKTEHSLVANILLSFSLKQNIPLLFNCESGAKNIGCLNGIRVLSINWVVLGHTLMFLGVFFVPVAPVDNFLEFANGYATHWTFLAVSNGTFSVDSFFVLSGFLLTYLCLPKLPKGTPDSESALRRVAEHVLFWLMYIAKRFIRLAPALVFLTLFTIGIWKVSGNGIGAMWQPYEQEVDACRKNWWTNFVFLSNFPNTWVPCDGWTWYISNDFQYFVLAIIPFVIFMKSKLLSALFVCFCILASMIANFAFAWANHIGPSVVIGFQNQDNVPNYQSSFKITFGDYYVSPFYRFGPYGIGMLLGYFSNCCPPGTFKMSKTVNCVLWFVSLALLAFVIYGLSGMLYGHFPSFALSALYNSVSRTVWGIGLAWIVFACMHGYGGMINSFLSWKVWIPFSRLTYLVYLLHPLVITYMVAASQTKFHYNNVNYASQFVAVLSFTYALAALAYLAVELPVVRIEKAIKQKLQSGN